MKTNRFLWLVLLVAILPKFLMAQGAKPCTLKMGTANKRSFKGFMFHKIIAADQEKFLVVSTDEKKQDKLKLELKDGLNKTVQQREINLAFKGQKLNFEDVITLDNQWYILSSYTNKSRKKRLLVAQSLDKTKLTIGKSAIKLAETSAKGNTKVAFSMLRTHLLFSFNHVLSPDKSKLLVYVQKPNIGNKQITYNLNIFDAQLNGLWTKKGSYQNVAGGEIKDMQGIVNNDGEAFFYLKYKNEKLEKKNRKDWSKYEVVNFTHQGNKMERHMVKLEKGGVISQFRIHPLSNGELFCAGYYSEESMLKTTGSFSYKLIPSSQEMEQYRQEQFSKQILATHLPKKERQRAISKGKDLVLKDYKIKEIIEGQNGNIFIIGENEVDIWSQSTPNSSNTTNYYSKNLLVQSFNQKNQQNWIKNIEKNLWGGHLQLPYFSFKAFVTDDNLCLFYNKEISKGNFGVIKATTIDNTGKTKDWTLYTPDRKGVRMQPLTLTQNGVKEIIFYNSFKYQEAFGKIDFNKMELLENLSQ